MGATLFMVLFWNRTTSWGIIAGMHMGVVATVGNRLYWSDGFPSLVFPLTFAAIIIVTYLNGSRGEQIPAMTAAEAD